VSSAEHQNVIPAQAGIQNADRDLDSHFRGNDGHLEIFLSCLKPNELGNYRRLTGNDATGVVARFIGFQGYLRGSV